MKSKKYSLWIIIGIVLLNSIGFSIVLPLLPFLVGKYLPSNQVALGMSILMSVFAVCSFFSAPVFGVLSDRYGRKNLLLISLIGSVIGYVLFGFGGALWILISGRIIDGLTAGNITILFAYIADTTEPNERAKWFSYVGATMGIGKIGGPALGGLLGSISIGLPFFATAALIFLSGVAVYFLLPESLPHEKRLAHLSRSNFNTFTHLKDIRSFKDLNSLLLIGVLFYVGLSVFQFNFTVFLKDIYHWTPVLIGGLLTFVGICEIITRAIILPGLLIYFNEKKIGVTGLVTLGIGLGLIILSIYLHSVVIVAFAVLFIISGEGLFDPTYNSILSQLAGENKQGKLQGINQSLQSANNAIIPLFAAVVYYYSPGILYAVSLMVVLAAAMLYVNTKS